MNTPTDPHTTRRAAWLAATLLAAQAALLGWSATLHSPGWDEVGHLAAGISHWRSGWFDAYRVNPPLSRLVMTAPAVLTGADVDWTLYSATPWADRPEFEMGPQLFTDYGTGALWYLTLSRWAGIPFAILGGWVCFAWARRLHGDRAGLVALALWVVSPTILCNAQLVTPDTASAALMTLACFAFWRWLERPGWSRAAAAGVALGLALLAKFTALVLGPLWTVLVVARLLGRREWAAAPPAQFALIAVLSVYVINAGYGFEDTLRPLGRFEFVSKALSEPRPPGQVDPRFGNRFAGTLLGRVPVPVPANYLQGIDVQKRDFEAGLRSYLRGEWRRVGWWYYYLYCLLVKEPLGILALALAAAGTAVARRPAVRFDTDLVPLACGLGVLGFVSSQTGFNHHVRYVLPALPLLYVFAARVVTPGRSWWAVAVVLACVVAAGGSSLWRYPHSMSYFNEAAGGPAAGPRHLQSSNVDWDQDLLFLKKWCDQHPDRRPLYVIYSGGFKPADLRFWDEEVFHNDDDATLAAMRDGSPVPCWYAVFVNRLIDPPESPDLFARFRNREPDEKVADTVYLFRGGPGVDGGFQPPPADPQPTP